MKTLNLFFGTAIVLLLALSFNIASAQYLVKSKIDEKKISGEIFKSEKVKLITEKCEGVIYKISLIDRNGFLYEDFIFPPSAGFSQEGTPDTLTNFHQKVIYKKDYEGRDTSVTAFNKINMLVYDEKIYYYTDYRMNVMKANYGNFYYERTTKTGLYGEVIEEKTKILANENTPAKLLEEINKNNSEIVKTPNKKKYEFNQQGSELYIINTEIEGKEIKEKHYILNTSGLSESEYIINDSGKEILNAVTDYNENQQPVKKSFFVNDKIAQYLTYSYLPNGLIASQKNYYTVDGGKEYDYTLFEYDKSGKLIKKIIFDALDKKDKIWDYLYEFYE